MFTGGTQDTFGTGDSLTDTSNSSSSDMLPMPVASSAVEGCAVEARCHPGTREKRRKRRAAQAQANSASGSDVGRNSAFPPTATSVDHHDSPDLSQQDSIATQPSDDASTLDSVQGGGLNHTSPVETNLHTSEYDKEIRNDPTCATTISLTNVGNNNAQIYVYHTWLLLRRRILGKSRKRKTRSVEDLKVVVKEEEDCMQGEEYTNLGAASSKTLAMAESTDTTPLRLANTFPPCITDDPVMEGESHTEAGERAPARSQHTFEASKDSSWHDTVQAVLNSADTVVKSATRISSHSPTAGTSEQILLRKPGPPSQIATPMHSINAPKEQLMTIRPLLMPLEGRPIAAHCLASRYFAAIVDMSKIPEFGAEYVNTDGRPSSILLTFKSIHDVDRLKELWDSIDREHSQVPKLAQVKLYRGDVSAGPTDMSARDAAADELASFDFMPRTNFL